MAPLETITQRLPSVRSCAICAAQRAIAAASSPRPVLVTSDDPTLITRVFAAAMRLGCTAALFLLDRRRNELVHAPGQLAAALAVDRGNHEPRRLPAQR